MHPHIYRNIFYKSSGEVTVMRVPEIPSFKLMFDFVPVYKIILTTYAKMTLSADQMPKALLFPCRHPFHKNTKNLMHAFILG